VIFVTSTDTPATSSDINYYDSFVQSAADVAGIGASINVDWHAIANTPTVNVYDHMLPWFADISAPIYNQNSELVATGLSELFGGYSTSLCNQMLYDEYGIATTWPWVWTGSIGDGSSATGYELGGSTGYAITALPSATDYGYWMYDGTAGINQLSSFPLYSISEQLTVSAVPLPAAAWLFGSGLPGIVGVCRRRKIV
jgi:hypothetical protein